MISSIDNIWFKTVCWCLEDSKKLSTNFLSEQFRLCRNPNYQKRFLLITFFIKKHTENYENKNFWKLCLRLWCLGSWRRVWRLVHTIRSLILPWPPCIYNFVLLSQNWIPWRFASILEFFNRFKKKHEYNLNFINSYYGWTSLNLISVSK